MEWVKTRLDDLNGYHQDDAVHPVWTRTVGGVHVYDSVVVLDKQTRFAPFCEQNGSADFIFGSRAQGVVAAELVATRQAALEDRGKAVEELDALRTELGNTRAQLIETGDHVREMRRSSSWRVTAPLRRLRRPR